MSRFSVILETVILETVMVSPLLSFGLLFQAPDANAQCISYPSEEMDSESNAVVTESKVVTEYQVPTRDAAPKGGYLSCCLGMESV